MCTLPHRFRWRWYFFGLISFPHFGQMGTPSHSYTPLRGALSLVIAEMREDV